MSATDTPGPAPNNGNVAAPGGVTGCTKNEVDFLRRVLPWPQVGSAGFVNLHYTKPDRNGMPGYPFTKVEDFVSRVLSMKRQPAQYKDIYFCLSSQTKAGKIIKGRQYAARHKDDALELKSTWLDLDVKPSAYPTTDAALAALSEFCQSTGYPKPTAIVFSGSGGAHVYWISDRALTVDEWRGYAEGLKALGIEHGLKADYGCTTDVVRILRVPGTFNHKTQPAKSVTLRMLAPKDINFKEALGRFRATVQPYVRRVKDTWQTFDPAAFPKRALDPELLTEEYQRQIGNPGGHESLAPEPLLERCPMMADALATGGKDVNQGQWMLQVLATTFCHNGREVAHRISKGHKGYTPAETDEMFDRKEEEQDSRNLGWPACKTFEGFGSKQCALCPHKDKIKSPLHLARPEQTPMAAPQQTPAAEPSFGDPYAELVGPAFPLDVLPPTLSKFVDAEHRAMGADPSAIAMATLTAIAGAINAKAFIRAGEGWFEKPILWTALVGQPSTMKSPIIDKSTMPLSKIDHERDERWRQEYAKWKKTNHQ